VRLRRSLERETKSRRSPGKLAAARAVTRHIGSAAPISRPTRTNDDTSSPSWSLEFDRATLGRRARASGTRVWCRVLVEDACRPVDRLRRERSGTYLFFLRVAYL
jgi:hypothetical protein